MKETVLGKGYDLSIAYISESRSRALNQTYRRKNKPANILSFPLSKTSGEIFLNLAEIKKWAPHYGRTGDKLVGCFLLHGLLHLKGMPHGDTMERTERRLRKRFRI